MPTYDYRCPACGPFEAVRRIAERDDCACPACGLAASRHTLNLPAIPARQGLARGDTASDGDAGRGGKGGREEAGRYGRMRHVADCDCCPPTPASAPAR